MGFVVCFSCMGSVVWGPLLVTSCTWFIVCDPSFKFRFFAIKRPATKKENYLSLSSPLTSLYFRVQEGQLGALPFGRQTPQAHIQEWNLAGLPRTRA